MCIKRIVIQSKGRGYGKSTLALLTQWVFTETPAHRLWLDVKDHNARAQHVYESAGFALEGTLRECVKNGDAFESAMIISILHFLNVQQTAASGYASAPDPAVCLFTYKGDSPMFCSVLQKAGTTATPYLSWMNVLTSGLVSASSSFLISSRFSSPLRTAITLA